jgi:hypothetical protein
VFQVHGVDVDGNVIFRRQIKRRHMLGFFQKLPPCQVGIEACASSHHWSRELQALGHTVRLMPPAYVKPYAERQKNDAREGGPNVIASVSDAKLARLELAGIFSENPTTANLATACRRKGHTVVRFESTSRMQGDRLVSVNEVPRLDALHETLMGEDLVRRFGSAMLPDICGAGDDLSIDRPDPPCDQVRVGEVANANCAVETFTDKVDETVRVARVNAIASATTVDRVVTSAAVIDRPVVDGSIVNRSSEVAAAISGDMAATGVASHGMSTRCMSGRRTSAVAMSTALMVGSQRIRRGRPRQRDR